MKKLGLIAVLLLFRSTTAQAECIPIGSYSHNYCPDFVNTKARCEHNCQVDYINALHLCSASHGEICDIPDLQDCLETCDDTANYCCS